METRIDVTLNLAGLERLATEFQSGIAAALQKEGEVWAADARSRCPVRTGKLRDSISGEVDAAALTLTLEATAEYALWVDQGTRHAAAQPFFTPALDQLTQRLPETVAREVREATR